LDYRCEVAKDEQGERAKPGGADGFPGAIDREWLLPTRQQEGLTVPASHATDEDARTFWVAASSKASEWLTIDLGQEREVRALQVNYVDYQSNLFESGPTVYTQFRMQHSRDGKRWDVIADLTRETRDRPNAYIELARPVRTRYIRYEHRDVASPNLGISDIVLATSGVTPLLVGLVSLVLGVIGFLVWSCVTGRWPFAIPTGAGSQSLPTNRSVGETRA
jgi:hypothetical protein